MISVCLLVYNHAHLLTEVINSILNQTFSDFEFIISDDCSTDDSYNKIIEEASKDSRIIPVRTSNNLGMAGNANYAISKATRKYIALLHHDDILNINTFNEWINCIESNKSIAFVFNDYKTSEMPSTNFYLKNKLRYVNTGKKFLSNILLKYWGCPVRGTAFFSKEYFEEAGGLNERFGMLADIDLWMRLSARWDVGYVDKPLIEVLQNRPADYPKDYTEFSWKRLFILFDIHSSNINRNNYPNYFHYVFRRFVFKNKVSFEIIKWHIYALLRKKYFIMKSYSFNSNNYEIFYSRFIRKIIMLFVKE